MDAPTTMAKALENKGQRYLEAENGIRRAQRSLGTWRSPARTVDTVTTVPCIFGVHGSALTTEMHAGLGIMGLNKTQIDKVITSGVRAAITGLSDMCTARWEALKSVPRPRPPAGRKRNAPVSIPPKPHVPSGWRADRGR